MKYPVKRAYQYHCLFCGCKLVSRSKTAAGTKRWKCTPCNYSTTKPRRDLTRKFIFKRFLSWLRGKASQAELTGSERTFRDQTSWCWNVAVPCIITGETYYCIVIDGIRVGGQVCLIARTVHYVVAWAWVPYESSTYWSELLRVLPPPTYVVCDGQKGLLKALALCWPDTIVQRCRFHAWLNVKAKLTLNPESTAGQELLGLAQGVLHVRTRRQARRWKRKLRRWYAAHHAFVDERTYKPAPSPRERRWRYTHERLRSAYRQLARITDDLLRSSYRADSRLPATTNHVEGGVNSQIRTLLKLHRGMPKAHQRKLVEWYLYSRSEKA